MSILSSIATTVTILFLISERLRESARQKLDFTNKRALAPAFKIGKNGIGSANKSQAIVLQQCRDLLQHNGRYLRVKLYPPRFLATIDRAKNSMFVYDQSFQEMQRVGDETFPGKFDITAFLVVIELLEKGDYPDMKLTEARVHLNDLKKARPDFVENFRKLGAAIASDLGQITSRLEVFFDRNQLES